MAEQTQLSLTERLRREFGLDATSDEDEDDSKGRNGKGEETLNARISCFF
jgi:hypothetical protein